MSIMSKENVAKEYFEKYIKDFEKRIGKNLTTEFNEHLKVLLNQVEKQQKEIKELKETNNQLSDYLYDSYYVSADEIREKIKEIESYTFTSKEEKNQQDYAIERIRELLEENNEKSNTL